MTAGIARNAALCQRQIAATARATGRMLVTIDAHAFDDLPGASHRLLNEQQLGG